MADSNGADVFAVPDLWRSSKLLALPTKHAHDFFDLDIKALEPCSRRRLETSADNGVSDEFFNIPDPLKPFSVSQEHEHQDEVPEAEVPRPVDSPVLEFFSDAWMKEEPLAPSTAEFRTWDGFMMPKVPEVAPIFLTEAGPKAYDAALVATEDPLGAHCTDYNVVQANPYTASLLGLALGRSSVFFAWDERTASFQPQLDKMRISGYSAEVLHGLQDRCLQTGGISRFLSFFVQMTYKAHPSPGRVALAKAVDSVLLAIQTKLGIEARQVKSLLHLQCLIEPVHSILAYFKTLLARINKGMTDEQILSLLFEETRDLEQGDQLLRDVMREVLNRVSEPWFEFVQQWLGVASEGGNPITKAGRGKSFVKVEDVAYMDDFGFENQDPDYVFDEARMPSFVPGDIARVVFECGRTLRLLRAHHPEHPLGNTDFVRSNSPPELSWHFDWDSAQRLQEEVTEYETSLLRNMRHQFPSPDHRIPKGPKQRNQEHVYELQLFGQQEDQLADRLLASIQELNKPLPNVSDTDNLSHLLRDRLFQESSQSEQTRLALTPHWSLLPLLSLGPLVESQARLINREYMGLLFSTHKLRDHISLQRDFQLFGNGLFCSRLSHALFDPELDTAQRQQGVALSGGVMGLRLDARENWPPASSELRLALMGVLTESYFSESKQAPTAKQDHVLPGQLSFAMRNLSDDEIERCMDPGSLEALDFLRLSYKPPTSLAPIITPVILAKYDKIFKLLLRVLRMLYVSSELFRDVNARTSHWLDVDNVSIRFRIEAEHFVYCISAYFFETGIDQPWSQFEAWMDEVRLGLENDTTDNTKARILSPDDIRERHERVLDDIMSILLLRKRQQPVLKLLEDIFTLVLKFSKLARRHATGQQTSANSASGDISPRKLYDSFKKKVDVFITVCRGLSEKRGLNSKQTRTDLTNEGDKIGTLREENTIDHLLIQLEMSGYYGGLRI